MTPQEMETAIARLFEGQDLLTGKVTELTDDVTELAGTVDKLTGNVSDLTTAIETLRAEAEADRKVQRDATEETRAAVNTMLGIAESMAESVRLLARAQQGTTQRLETLETRVNGPENREGS